MGTKMSQVEQILLDLCRDSANGLSSAALQAKTPDISEEYTTNALNNLLAKHRLNILQRGGELSFQYISEGEALKLKGLSAEDQLIYQQITRAGNMGIWTKDLKLKTNLQNVQVTRILKTLEGRGLVKNVKSVQHANRKVYMLAELEPAREITGGAWYTDQEFDAAFIDVLREFCHKHIQEEEEVTLANMVEALRLQRVSNVELGPGEVQSILRTLVYDGHVESLDRGGEELFRLCKDCAPETTAFTAIPCVQCGPIAPGQGFLPGGNLRTVDNGGPYNLSALSVQANEVAGGIAAKQAYTDKDIIDFLTNVECLEGLFDTWGTFGRGFLNGLDGGAPTPIGAKKANLSEQTLRFLQEVALNEQGHALFTRQAGGVNPCPALDFTGGFNKLMAAAYGIDSVQGKYGVAYDPFLNDQNFVLSVLTLEELGATGNKGLIGLTTNPVLANAIAGLATSATAQAAIERFLLYQLRDTIIQPFGETAQQAFARVSALRESLTGTGLLDQGLVNTDPRFIAVPDGFVNLIPTDVRGLTRNRTPQQIINILTLGNPDGVGVFFPNGLLGAITKPTGYNATVSGLDDVTKFLKYSSQETVAQVGTIMPPLQGQTPTFVEGEEYLIEPVSGPFADASATNRGLAPLPTNYIVQGINSTISG